MDIENHRRAARDLERKWQEFEEEQQASRIQKYTQNMLLDHRSQSIVKEHWYPTRSKSTPNLPGAMNAKYRSSFLYSAIREYSALDNNLKQAKTFMYL